MQGTHPPFLLNIGIGAGLEENLCKRDRSSLVGMSNGAMQRPHGHRISGGGFEIGSASQQEREQVGMAEEGGEFDRAEPVWSAAIDRLRILLEQFFDSRQFTQAGGFEKVEIISAIRDLPRQVARVDD